MAITDLMQSVKEFEEWAKTKVKALVPGAKQESKAPVPAVKEDMAGGKFQSPLKGAWLNLGDFSPGVATDARHLKGHNGLDMLQPKGSAIYPMAPGVAKSASNAAGGSGAVVVDHGNNLKTYYAHGDSKIKDGQMVDMNTVIATVSDNGNAKGSPHLHFECWISGKPVNPGNYFSVPRYDSKAIAQFVKDRSTKVVAEIFYLLTK